MCKTIMVSPERIRQSVSLLLQEIDAYVGLTEERGFAIRLVLNELMANAVCHGKGVVRMLYALEGGMLRCCVMDEGDGFCVEEINCDAGTLNESGRGISLVRALADELRYNKKGNVVVVRLCLT